MGRYNGSLTREQFLFYEMRTTAKLMAEGLSEDEVVIKIIEENLFQYPTERSVKKMAKVCVARLNAMKEQSLVQAIATQSSEVAKQICLYAIMKYSKLVYEFMVTVIGDKYSSKDHSFGKIDLNVFFMRLQEQDDDVASWSDSTIQKIKQVITRMLVETEYIDNTKSDHLNLVWLNPILENIIQERGETEVLKAFNYFL
ncbi:MAG: DUF1819 family protein [Candidatus Cloacimonetes bacterium]|nr:DUF1819 family protein [Candidatus Cloacimonadota bacterium]